MKRKRAQQAVVHNNVINIDQRLQEKRKRVQIYPKNLSQETYLLKLNDPQKIIIFAIGPAGTGKTMLAVQWAIDQLKYGTADRIVITRPAVSVDEQMAYDKARLQAERKLIEMMTARVRTNTKSFRADTGDAMAERMEVTVNKTADGELIGAQRVDSQAVFDGRSYKVYVLLRLPVGDANVMAKSRAATKLQREADIRSQSAHRDLEKNHHDINPSKNLNVYLLSTNYHAFYISLRNVNLQPLMDQILQLQRLVFLWSWQKIWESFFDKFIIKTFHSQIFLKDA